MVNQVIQLSFKTKNLVATDESLDFLLFDLNVDLLNKHNLQTHEENIFYTLINHRKTATLLKLLNYLKERILGHPSE